jgi:hypothetical protein
MSTDPIAGDTLAGTAAGQPDASPSASTSPPSAPEPKQKFRFRLMEWLGLLVGVVGLVTAYYYYIRSLPTPEITWWSTDQIVFNAQNVNPDIKVVDRSGAQIERNVYALNISFSNTGSTLLEHANDSGSLVRSPLTISLIPSDLKTERILSASIASLSEQPPVNLRCKLSDEGVSVTWDHFDPRTGFRLLFLYTGPQQIVPKPDINVVGLSNLNRFDVTPRMTEVPEVRKWTRRLDF